MHNVSNTMPGHSATSVISRFLYTPSCIVLMSAFYRTCQYACLTKLASHALPERYNYGRNKIYPSWFFNKKIPVVSQVGILVYLRLHHGELYRSSEIRLGQNLWMTHGHIGYGLRTFPNFRTRLEAEPFSGLPEYIPNVRRHLYGSGTRWRAIGESARACPPVSHAVDRWFGMSTWGRRGTDVKEAWMAAHHRAAKMYGKNTNAGLHQQCKSVRLHLHCVRECHVETIGETASLQQGVAIARWIDQWTLYRLGVEDGSQLHLCIV